MTAWACDALYWRRNSYCRPCACCGVCRTHGRCVCTPCPAPICPRPLPWYPWRYDRPYIGDPPGHLRPEIVCRAQEVVAGTG